jgi:WD40 repeat protein
MTPRLPAALAAGVLTLFGLALAAPAQDAAKPKPNFKDHVEPILRAKCNGCHNGDAKKGGLSTESFATLMQGGGSGEALVEPGDPDNSRLYLLVAHEEEPKMPPNAAKLPDADLATLKAWIAAGAPETSGSVVAMKEKPKLDFKLDPAAMGKPQGPPAMPEGVLTEVVTPSPRPNAITALAASPWAPLVAVAGHKQILLYNTQTRHLGAVLPFPEGDVYSLKFSRDGAILLAGGGRGAERGLAVAFDVKSGKRLFEVGKEYDVVLACDLSPDRALVALGGPSKTLRVYNTADGELAYETKKHTEWITAVEFSPDGVLLASGDRNGGLLVWEGATGREFHDLRNHTAMIADVSWRLDSNALASASEDGSLRLWEMEDGKQVKTWNSHGGALAVRFAKDGRLASTGRDRVTRLWDQNGKALREFEGFADVGLKVAFTFDDAAVIAGDWAGEVRVWEAKEGKRLANLSANPAPLAARLEAAQAAVAPLRAAAEAAQAALAPLRAEADAKAKALEAAQAALAQTEAAAKAAGAEVAAAEAALAPKAQEAEAAGKRVAGLKGVQKRLEAVVAEATAALAESPEPVKPAAEATLAAAKAQTAAVAAALATAEPATAAAIAARDAAAKAVAEITPRRDAADAALAAAKAGLDPAQKAKAAADAALAEKAPAAEAAQAAAAAAAAEVEALAAEKAAAEKAGVAPGTPVAAAARP